MDPFKDNLSNFWDELKGDQSLLAHIKKSGPFQVLPSAFDVTSFATASIGSALLAAAELKHVRSTQSSKFPTVEISTIEACAAYKGDSLFQPNGWQVPPPWDPFAGDYPCNDGWIRLHTNYNYHLDAVFKVLGTAANRDELSAKVKTFSGDGLEQSIVDAGGCAAFMRTAEEWKSHVHGRLASQEKIISFTKPNASKAKFKEIDKSSLPLKGIRVLDITRVIAGPTCTKFLSAQGAEVLRIDPFGFEEVPALLPETTVGKKRAFLNLASQEGKNQFEKLIREAHVFVHGLRPEALSNLGFSSDYLKSLNPSLIVATLDAYGWNGPWKLRRGFDSLVQMSSGIAAEGARQKGSIKPTPLPVQALDHGAGYLLAAGICRALTELYKNEVLNEVRSSLVGASNILQLYSGDFDINSPSAEFFSSTLIDDLTAWGGSSRVFAPGKIDGRRGGWNIMAGQIGIDQPHFSTE